MPNFIHPHKKAWIETGDEEINALLPKLSEKEHTYLQLITSENYKALVANIQKYLGVAATRENLPSLMGALFSAARKTIQIEASHKAQLEELALNTVLGLEEFHMVQEAYVNGDVKFQIALTQPTIDDYRVNEQPPEQGELSEEEKLNAELASLFNNANLNDVNTRRRLANLLITGGAFSKMYLFHLVEPRLNGIDKNLIKLYGALGALAELGYWIMPDGIEEQAAGNETQAAGVEEVVPEGGIYTIKAKAITFPYLIHEIVKGIYEYLSINSEFQEIMKGEKLHHETRDVLVGPALFKKILAMVPSDKQKYLPLIQRKLITLPLKDTQEILKQSGIGKRLINDLIVQSEMEWNEYKKQKEDYLNG